MTKKKRAAAPRTTRAALAALSGLTPASTPDLARRRALVEHAVREAVRARGLDLKDLFPEARFEVILQLGAYRKGGFRIARAPTGRLRVNVGQYGVPPRAGFVEGKSGFDFERIADTVVDHQEVGAHAHTRRKTRERREARAKGLTAELGVTVRTTPDWNAQTFDLVGLTEAQVRLAAAAVRGSQ